MERKFTLSFALMQKTLLIRALNSDEVFSSANLAFTFLLIRICCMQASYLSLFFHHHPPPSTKSVFCVSLGFRHWVGCFGNKKTIDECLFSESRRDPVFMGTNHPACLFNRSTKIPQRARIALWSTGTRFLNSPFRGWNSTKPVSSTPSGYFVDEPLNMYLYYVSFTECAWLFSNQNQKEQLEVLP